MVRGVLYDVLETPEPTPAAQRAQRLVRPGRAATPSLVARPRSYRVQELLGEGGMGRVYLALDTATKRRVALKVLKPEAHAWGRDSFEREIHVGTRFSHRNLVRVFDSGGASDREAWMAMEYLEGCDLGQIIDDGGRLGIPALVEVFVQALDALAHVHARDIVHCDVKPGNLFVTCDRFDHRMIVKLIDFGISRIPHRSEPASRARGFVGDPHYMAPEQASHARIDARADLYALGISLYEAATGVHPLAAYFDRPVPQLLLAHQEHVPTPPSSLLPGGLPPAFGAALDHICARACAIDPDERFSTAEEMRAAVATLGDLA